MREKHTADFAEDLGSYKGADRAALERGFTPTERTHQPYPYWGPYLGEDENGNTFEGTPRTRGGFLTRPQGDER